MKVDREIELVEIERLRAHWWRTAQDRRISGERSALRFISGQGFVLLIPISGSELPSIHAAAGRSWGVWWDWKQTLPSRKACYYAKLIRRRGTFVDWDWFPAFYAAYADGRPYWRLYREGLLNREEKQVLDLLSADGPMMTRELRLAFAPASKQNTRRVKQVLVDLQARFLVCPAGGSTEGWSHHRWALVDSWVPAGALTTARKLSRETARRELLRKFVENVLATTPAEAAWAFGWGRGVTDGIAADLLEAGELQTATVPELGGEVIVPSRWPRVPGRRRR